MKKVFLTLVLVIMTALALVGCSRPVEGPDKTDAEIVSATATAQANLAALPVDVPIHPEAETLKFAAGNITYIVTGDVDTITNYYRAELETQGWEKRGNSPESPIGGALTLLRVKPDKNISVTIQSIPESDQVRVMITLILK